MTDTGIAMSVTEPGRPAGAQLTLKSSQFRLAREASWRDLETLITKAEKRGPRSLGPDELERLPLLYRTLLSSLSVARSIALDRNLLNYLEALAVRSFLVVYGPRVRQLPGIIDFLTQGLPKAVRHVGWHILLASLATLGGVLAGFLLVHGDESWFAALVPGDLAGERGPDSTAAELRSEELFAPYPGVIQAFALFANFLFDHNTLVGILIFSLGVAGGVPTILLLIYQGATLGAFIALHADRGLFWESMGWLSIHGVTEIGAIIVFGAGGLLIAEKMLFPGRKSRMENLATEGRFAAQIAIGGVLMLFVAAILEGGFRQLVQSTDWRLTIGAVSGLLWLSYFSLAGRKA